MKKSPVYPRYETHDYNGDEYNPHADFSQFLEEARQNETKTDSLIQSEEDVLSTKQDQDETKKKKKKPWKAFVLRWWKVEKKSDNPQVETPISFGASKKRRAFTSGPIYGGSSDGRPHGPFSGPVMSSLFSPIRKASTETPYVCLNQLARPCADKNYGPVYLVT